MQVENYYNWPMRSLCYLCRRFDTASRGADYNTVKPVYHVGFLDFTLFEEHPEFVAKYKLRNDKDGHVYTDNFNLFVISLNQTELATQEDKAYGIDKWAKLFKAKTWEEIKMITKDNPSMNSTAESIFMSDADFLIREQCRRREDAIAHEKYQKELIETLTKEKETIAKEKESIAEKYDTLASEYERLKKLLADNDIDPNK